MKITAYFGENEILGSDLVLWHLEDVAVALGADDDVSVGGLGSVVLGEDFDQAADILEVAATLPGAERVWWCKAPFPPGRCQSSGYLTREAENYNHADCGWRLVIPLEDT